jgi:hypothetical protein
MDLAAGKKNERPIHSLLLKMRLVRSGHMLQPLGEPGSAPAR